MNTDRVLVLNAGSSSLKFTVYERLTPTPCEVNVSGQIAGFGAAPRLVVSDAQGKTIEDRRLDGGLRDGRGALDVLAQWLRSRFGRARLAGVGHRVVHGGTRYRGPTLVTPEVLSDLRELTPLAPLHMKHNLAAIEAAVERMPGVRQVACFDTSFHHDQPAVARLVALPRTLCGEHLQRYGFHGLSYEYIASVLQDVAPEIADGRVIVAHLGSGASMCAMKARKSVDSTFGFTALDGLCMGTRPGSTDPGVVLYLFQGLGLSAQEVQTVLYEKSGLLGISGISNDMRTLLASDAPAAQLAVDYFIYRAVKEIGALTAVLGGLDAIVFTGGIGEKSAEIRRRICHASAWLGIELDDRANQAGEACMSAFGSRPSVWTVPTNEELMIARHTGALLGLIDAPA